ncbi:MAG: bifunctional shikimate kinase/3-dehydroquinate synthase [Candidatus Limnocylindrales bacterium]
MELVLAGPPGSGKSAVGRLIAARRGVPFVDLDAWVEEEAGRPIAAIFEAEGEAGFRARERAAIARLGPAAGAAVGPWAGAAPDEANGGPARVTRVIALGGGAVVDPRNRWLLFRGRRVLTLWAPPAILLRRLRSVPPRPMLSVRNPAVRLTELLAARARWYAAGERVDASGPLRTVAVRVEARLASPVPQGTPLLQANTPVGRLTIGEGDALLRLLETLAHLEASRVAVVSEPVAWRLHGERLAHGLGAAGLDVAPFLVPRGEAAKTVPAYARLLRAMAAVRLERGDPVVAVGGGALGDAAGFAAATYLRGVPLIHVPTTLVGQIDSAIGGKTAIDIPEGKNLVGAFHQPRAIVVDLATLATLPARQRRAALGEAIKYAALGDERLFEILEREAGALGGPVGSPAGRGFRWAYESGAVAELVERCAWAKTEIVAADEREQAGRVVLNLGHSIGHAVEAAAGYRRILHGEAVACGLRGALAVGLALGLTPPERAARIERLLAAAGLAQEPPGVDEAAVRAHLALDKKHAAGRLRWVVPTESGVVVRADVPDQAVAAGIAAALRGAPVGGSDPGDKGPAAPASAEGLADAAAGTGAASAPGALR